MIDPHSDTWRAIEAHVQARETKLLTELATSGKTETEYENYRGQIKALRAVLSLATGKPARTP